MSFTEISGQENAIEMLAAQVSSGRMPHAYIFAGSEGIGKKKTAIELAKTLNCASPKSLISKIDNCGQCISCSKINKGIHPDVHVIDFEWQAKALEEDLPKSGKNVIKIDSIRIIQKEMSMKSFEGKYKVFIIDSAEKINTEAANCLLKTLEEPSPDSLIILVTPSIERLPRTIVSRCQKLRFAQLPLKQIKDFLKERYKTGETESSRIAEFSEGSLAKAIANLESYNELYGIGGTLKLWENLKNRKLDIRSLTEFSQGMGKNRDNIEQFLDNLSVIAGKELEPETSRMHDILSLILESRNSLRYNINLGMFSTLFLMKLRQELA